MRTDTIANALAEAASEQGVIRVADLDFEQLAAAVESSLGQVAGGQPNPIDPEGDGLTPRELNAANDI